MNYLKVRINVYTHNFKVTGWMLTACNLKIFWGSAFVDNNGTNLYMWTVTLRFFEVQHSAICGQLVTNLFMWAVTDFACGQWTTLKKLYTAWSFLQHYVTIIYDVNGFFSMAKANQVVVIFKLSSVIGPQSWANHSQISQSNGRNFGKLYIYIYTINVLYHKLVWTSPRT